VEVKSDLAKMVDACDKLKAENATLVQKQGSSETAVAQVPQQ